jgi:trk system potassium uptake protein TrkH
VDVAAALDVVGTLLKWFALAFAAPAVLAATSGESPLPFLASGAITGLAGLLLDRLVPTDEETSLGTREGFLMLTLIWLLVPAFGCLPFLIGGVDQLASPVDAYFEAVSGFTATGATVVAHVDELGRGMLFWRQLSHWLGGLGIVVLAIAVLPRLRVGGRQLLQSELPGPTEIERLGTTIRETARLLWSLYVGVSVAGTLLLALLGWTGLDDRMDLFEAFSHATSAIALGGFSTQAQSAAAFAPVTQWALCGLMVLAGVNLLRLHRLLIGRDPRTFFRDEELRLYLALLAAGSALIGFELILSGRVDGIGGVRHAVFDTVSVMTTTGFSTLDWTTFGPLATLTLLLLMFVGASAGSASGSIKVVRHLMLFRMARRELEQAVHPESVVPVRVSGVTIDERALRSTVMFVVLYLLTFAIGAVLLLLDARRTGGQLGAFEAIGAAAACLGNVGPSFGSAGPLGSYAGFSNLSTGILGALMVLGRVEIVPIVLMVTRTFWRTR